MALHHGHATSIEGLRCDTILGMKEPHQYFAILNRSHPQGKGSSSWSHAIVILNRSEGSSSLTKGEDVSLRLNMTMLHAHRQWL